MSSPPGWCGCWPDHWPALKEQKATTTKASARSRYLARGEFPCDLDLGELSSSTGSSDVESLSYWRFGMAGQDRNSDQKSRLTWDSTLLRGTDTSTDGVLSRSGSHTPSLGCEGDLSAFLATNSTILTWFSFRILFRNSREPGRAGFGFTRPFPWTPLLLVTRQVLFPTPHPWNPGNGKTDRKSVV